MDREVFDALTKLLAETPSRRKAVGALLGAALTGALGAAEAAKKDRSKDRKNRKNRKQRKDRKSKGAAALTAQAADCLSPGPSSNLNGCTFEGRDFSGDDLSGSSMVGTSFQNAELAGAKLFSSNLRGANFRGANLCGADLSSSTLRNADFRGFAAPGRATNLTLADLSSSGCAGIRTNDRTILCGTTWCDGTIRNESCPGGPPPGGGCGDVCPPGWTPAPNGGCGKTCAGGIPGACTDLGNNCTHCGLTDIGHVCTSVGQPCGSSPSCPEGHVCASGACRLLCQPSPSPSQPCPPGWTELPDGTCAKTCAGGIPGQCTDLGGNCSHCSLTDLPVGTGHVCTSEGQPCSSSASCPDGHVCASGACRLLCPPSPG